MSDPVWYYARGESEQGPISTAQIKALAAAGALKKDDLVWKEGMENWLPASDVSELFPGEPKKKDSKENPTSATSSEPHALPRHKRQRFLVEERELMRHVRTTGRGLIVFGVLVVLMARGCDSLGNRKVARLNAISESAEVEFQREWERQKSGLEDEQLTLSENQTPSEVEQQRLSTIPQEIAALDQAKRNEQRRLRRGRWHNYQVAAETAENDNAIWSYWRRLGFLFGTMVLAVGLLGITPTTDGPERWISLVMLTVILYSVYASGSVWDGGM